MSLKERITAEFVNRFHAAPTYIIRAPGRVNLIGEHTDYNEGFVLPMAIDRAIWVALRPRHDRNVALYSLDFDQEDSFFLDDFQNRGSGWIEYVKGIAWALREAEYGIQGWEGIIAGDIPQGAGLSSSAALEIAAARAFAVVSDISWDPKAMAKIGHKAENDWVGMKCGIMDQMIAAAGREGCALLIDCRSLETRVTPLPTETSIVVLDTATRRELVDSVYNERRAQCEAAARFFDVQALRDLSLEKFELRAEYLDPVIRRRARHVISENMRTLQAAEAMIEADAVRLGQLFDASHASLRDDFHVSSQELDLIVELARGQAGCLGARMTGAGFGGCAVALVRVESIDVLKPNLSKAYREKTGHTPDVYVCSATGGAELIEVGHAPA
jgi:galactokinase